MSTTANITPRPIYIQDLALTTNHIPVPVTEYVAGVGNVPLTPISVVLLTSFTPAADDPSAQALGVQLGRIYYNTTHSALVARLT